MLALNCAAHKTKARLEIAMLNNEAVNIREDDKDEKEQEIARLTAVIDVLLKGGTPTSNVIQLPEAGQ
ncbi:hypothetical protein AO354_20775 [Pseudomonas syringae pv. syringae]|nr:hypothetical protein AO354_20775 [Pseudomonas syringae pv. syringae]